ncbi:MAG: cupin domain-containing protein [Proteobacteria bacterium]|nr:hypothetical protein [Pseudomonadota bacterium]NOG59922.1 cupin domain-containing protein [Pseudomonadota bacterium]
MATHHAQPGEIVDLATWANDLQKNMTKVVMKSEDMEIARLVIPSGKLIPDHKVSGPIIVHCIQGKIKFTAMGKMQELNNGELLYLEPSELHSLEGIDDAVILLTILFKN